MPFHFYSKKVIYLNIHIFFFLACLFHICLVKYNTILTHYILNHKIGSYSATRDANAIRDDDDA